MNSSKFAKEIFQKKDGTDYSDKYFKLSLITDIFFQYNKNHIMTRNKFHTIKNCIVIQTVIQIAVPQPLCPIGHR